MNKEFVPYEPALELRKLGFNKECLATIDQTEYIYIKGTKYPVRGTMCYNEIDCPTFSQAFRWFRERHELFHNIWNYTHGEPTDKIPNGFTFSIDEEWICIIGKNTDGIFEKYYATYEEAELECLIKLIEIVKNNLKINEQ